MRPLLLFIVLVASVLLAGALLAWPMHLLLSMFFETRFHKIVHYTTVLTALAPGVYYLQSSRQVAVLGLNVSRRNVVHGLIIGFAGGALLLLIIESCLYLLNMRQADPDLGAGMGVFVSTVVKALISGLLVGLLEETLYRGAIFSGLRRYINLAPALILSSFVYAAVHFIRYPAVPAGSDIHWDSGLNLLVNAFTRFSDPLIIDSFLTLFMLGLLLCLVRLRTGNIIQSIGIHAGIVAVTKIMSYATDYQPGSPYDFLVNSRDQPNGNLATLWLTVAVVLYYFFYVRRNQTKIEQ